MSRIYAETTKVPVSQTQGEIKEMLRSIGANKIAIVEDDGMNEVAFVCNRIGYRLSCPPVPDDGRRDPSQMERAVWRALGLLIKAKRVAITQGISTVEREFFADMVTSKGTTMIEHHEQIREQAGGSALQLGFSNA